MSQELCKVAVTSRSFSKHEGLRNELLKKYPETDFNDLGESLSGQMLVEFLSGHTKAITALDPASNRISIILRLDELVAEALMVSLAMIMLDVFTNCVLK